MTDTRKRLASTTASQSSAQKRNGASARSLSSGSITPMEEEDDKPLRSTRFRNPLPPSKGPLFPPLPPKIVRPRPSPKASNTSTSQIGDIAESDNIAGPSRLPETPRKASTPDVDKPTIPSGSGTSLTPPPPTSDDVEMIAENQEVKDEPGTDNEETPRQPRNRRNPSATPTGSATSERGASQVRRRRGEEQLLLDDHLLPAEMRRTGKMTGKRIEKQEDEEPEEEDAGGDEVTRCVCQLEDGDPLMVACDKCNVWQHGPCVGIWADEEAPDEYFCERCRPDLHGPLRKWIRSRGRNIAHFIPPSPEDLKSLHSPHDKYPPSQSKRWRDKPKPPSRRKDPSPERPKKLDPPREKSLAKSEAPRSAGKERRMSHTRRISDVTSPQRDSHSPTAREPKKRSTMNSRDAMYELEVKAAIEASRREMEPEETVPEVEPEEEEKEERKAKGKRKRDEDDTEPIHKVKHPNQYTYRPKPNIPVPSPARKAGTPTPQIPAPALHEHGTRRAGALANGAREAPFIAVSVTHLGWNLPEYLSSFSDILPTSNPTPLQVRSPRQFLPIPKNHFFNHKYGPFTDVRDESGSLTLPPDPMEREPTGQQGETHTEPPARIKYPQRRITTGEMRKRVRHMQDFCTRVQVEERRRGERRGKVGIPQAERPEDVDMSDIDGTISTSTGPSSSQLLAELAADLTDFQETWARGGFTQNGHSAWGGNSPIPPNSATFPSSGWPTSGLANVVTGHEDDTSSIGESGQVVGDEEVIMEQAEEPVEVYREGQVTEVVATQAEVEAAEIIAGGMGIGLGISGGLRPGESEGLGVAG